MERQIKVNLLKEKDAEQVSDLIRENLMEVNIKHYQKEEMERLSKEYTPQKLLTPTENKLCFVAEKEGKLVGTACLTIFKERREGWISAVFIRKEFHGQGMGKVLLNHLEERAKQENISRLLLHSSITAKKFYLSNGYQFLSLKITENQVYQMQKSITKNEP